AWIDEGRLPKMVYEARILTEDSEGILWASGGNGKILRVTVAPTGMRDSKVEALGQDAGLPDSVSGTQFAAGSIFAFATRSKHMYRWDGATRKFVVDDRFLLPIDDSDATS